MRVDNELDRVSLGRSIMIFPKFSVFGYYEYRLDLGLVNDLPVAKSIHQTPFGALVLSICYQETFH
jgi:hypothetical protein